MKIVRNACHCQRLLFIGITLTLLASIVTFRLLRLPAVPLVPPTNQSHIANISRPYYHLLRLGRNSTDKTFFRLRETQVSTYPNTYLIPGKDICRDGQAKAEAVFLVPTVASEVAARERLEIRSSWASSVYDQNWRQISTLRLAFFFGAQCLSKAAITDLYVESSKFRDIVVIEDLIDSYANLSLKVSAMLTWAAHECPQVEAAIKVDMDTYVNVGVLLELVNQLPSKRHPNFIFGCQHEHSNPLVMRTGKWKVPNETYPFKFFPRYLVGHSYVVSKSAVTLLASSFPYFPVVPNEDAFITGIMAVTLNISRFYHSSFANKFQKERACAIAQGNAVSVLAENESIGDFRKSALSVEC